MGHYTPDKLNILDIPYKNFAKYLSKLDGWVEEFNKEFSEMAHDYYTEFRHYYVNNGEEWGQSGAKFPSCRIVIMNDQDSDYGCFNWRTIYLGTVACITGKSITEIIEKLKLYD